MAHSVHAAPPSTAHQATASAGTSTSCSAVNAAATVSQSSGVMLADASCDTGATCIRLVV